MAGDREDELAQTALAASQSKPGEGDLARTATAPAAAGTPAAPIGKTLGRYRLERELGAGGMGVVHAAFDPDLERRVALKVLLNVDGDDAHKQRLQREAKAMARLAHPNVVTVHEVGTVNGRDYVAMELIDGESLAEWLRSAKRPEAEILDAFLAAGRGLAAAHAAGMVHRDFKPHNILRSKAGRIAVTDFGLAREATADPFAATDAANPKPISVARLATAKSASSGHTPSTPLAGLTMTGAVLGTPAYMAPEQWAGGSVTPATDQFAFCVAVWEALSGERPFRGDTAEMLRRAVELGPAPLDDSKIPRRLRAVLRRGLDPIPSRRWPSMDALLAEMAPPKRSSRVVAIGAGAVVLATTGYLFATRTPPTPPPLPVAACPAPSIDPSSVVVAGQPLATSFISADIERWKTARQKACALEPTPRATRVACLDRVLGRLDAVARGVAKLGSGTQPIEVGKYLIDPAVCEAGPRLEPTSPLLADAIAAAIKEDATPGPVDRDAAAALIKRVVAEACASTWAHLHAAHIPDAERGRHVADAEQAAERCGDDRIRAETAIRVAAFTLGRTPFGMPNTAKLKVAIAAVERVSQTDLAADVDVLQMQYAAKIEKLGEAIVHGERAMAGYATRGLVGKQLDVGLEINRLRELRGSAEDLKLARDRETEWHALATSKLGVAHPTTRKYQVALVMREFDAGDVLGAQAKLEKLREPQPLDRTRKIAVKVVDATGKPVAGATVTAGSSVWGAGSAAAFPDPTWGHTHRSGVSSASGELVLVAPHDGMMIAQLGDQRSRPALIADSVTLALEPTSRVEGKVDLRGEDPSKVIVAINDIRTPPSVRYELVAPVKPDGSFVVDGVPRTKIKLFAALQMGTSRSVAALDLVVGAAVVRDVKIAVANHNRTIHVVVRSTVDAPVGGAQVFIQPRPMTSTTLDKFRVDGSAAIRFAKHPDEKTPAAVKTLLRPGDVVATLSAPPTKTASACAIGVPAEIDDPDFDRKIRDNLAKIEVRCSPVAAGAETVVVEVPPWPRLQ